ncbi:hypothetical protein Ddye_020286 [Dipteronia dyeriana]|uniref:Transposase, Ptta/En/Spm, plant n=1 Tax=Dipteronia dyeriana TaxID=168575 RepID=A0AAD9WVV3_9ROSI|nr:hypothetical protein Ddye_020286 [Dipteronia dyeriana]
MAKRNRRIASTSSKQHDPMIPSLTDQIIETRELRLDGQPYSEGVLFKQSIKGPWVTYAEYPKEESDTLYARFKSNFNYTCFEDVLRAAFNEHVRIRYPEWMSSIRQSVFKEFKTTAERYTNGSDHIPAAAWSTMVDTWLSKKWQEKSERNKKNHDTKDIVVHTTGSVPMAKYRKEEFERNGIEPSPFEFFKKFHSYKDNNWASEKAEEMHKKMDSNKPPPETENARAREWEIYREVTGKPRHGCVLGLGAGLKPNDVFTSSIIINCGKRICLESQDEMKAMREEIHILKDLVHGLKNLFQTMASGSSQSTDNIIEDSNAHIERELDSSV